MNLAKSKFSRVKKGEQAVTIVKGTILPCKEGAMEMYGTVAVRKRKVSEGEQPAKE